MKEETLNQEKLYGIDMRGVKIFLYSLVTALILFIGYGKEARAEWIVPLNIEQTYELPQGHYVTFCITVPEDGVISISGYNASGDGIELSLIDESNNVIRNDHKGGTKTAYLNSYGVRKGSRYYLKVESWPYSWKDYTMKYTVNFTPTSYWEKEYNDSSSIATNISAGAKYRGNLTNQYDVDYYKFKLASDAKVSITFGPEMVDGNNHPWIINLLNSKGESTQIYYDSTTKTYTNYLKKGTYYIKVSGVYSSTSDNYILSYKKKNLTVSVPNISSATAKGQHIKQRYWWSSKITYDNYVLLNKIKIKMKSDCEGYTVKVAKRSNMKGGLLSQNIDVVKKTSLTLDKHFPVYKNYYLRMRGYVTTPFGEKIYGKYSKAKKISLSASDYKKCK